MAGHVDVQLYDSADLPAGYVGRVVVSVTPE